jgi:hypothetical protein
VSKFFCSSEQFFDSSHLDPGCGPYLHGHRFHVKAHEEGTDAGVRADLPTDLRAVLLELDQHPLGDMLVGGAQTLAGIAAWIMERLLSRRPRLTEVEVWTDDDYRVGVTREIR